MKRKSLFYIILGAFLFAPLSVSGATFDTVVIFGDSLSDNGNLYALTGQTTPLPTLYYQGRFSNGPVWIESLTGTDFFDCTLVDKAYGGAKTEAGPADPPGLLSQVGLYIATAQVPDKALFVIWIGANDFLGGAGVPVDSVGRIEDALEDLAQFGAENILILNLPDLGATPRMILLGNPSAAAATAVSQAFNAALGTAVDDFEVAYPDIEVYELNIYALFGDLSSNPGEYGFTNATEVSPNYSVQNEWDNAAGYAFWDDIHPTTEAHEVIAEEAYELLNPEDGTNGNNSCFIGSVFSLN